MCTLSWQVRKGALTLTFNRDESLSRQPALPPALTQQSETQILAPSDPVGGGSWVSVNDRGLVLCLLNDYVHQTSEVRRSRGLLLTDLADSHDLSQLSRRILAADLTQYAPFRLVVFAGPQAPGVWHWNGQQLSEVIAPSSPLSSSSLWPGVTPRLRQFWFRRQTGRNLATISAQQQLSFHQSAKPLHPSLGVKMKRQQRATVSLCQIELTHENARVFYQDCQSGEQSHHELAVKTVPDVQGLEPVSRDHPLDFEALLRAKNPALHQSLPSLVWPVMRWLLCQGELNRGLTQLNGESARAFCAHVLDYLSISAVRYDHSQALPEAKTRPVFLANHPTGGADGLILIAWLSQYYPDIKVVVTDALLELPHLAPFVVPVDRYRKDHSALRNLHNAFAGNGALLVFPAGRTGRKVNGQLTDAPWQKMPVTLARQYQRSLVPLHLETQNSAWFYGIHQLRTALSIKLNLEMLLLVRELLKPAVRQVELRLGKTLAAEQWLALGETDHQRLHQLRLHYDQLAGTHTAPGTGSEVYP